MIGFSAPRGMLEEPGKAAGPGSAARAMTEHLIEITERGHGVLLDILYATPRNISGRPVYSRPGCYLHPQAALRLEKAVALAGSLGFTLKIFDAFRPAEAQWRLWQARPDPDFLADPRRGSPHSRGAAVDLTLVGRDGMPLEMGTSFDDFTPLSHHASTLVSEAAQRNRLILLGLMTAAGWDFYRREWWHYQLFAAARYPLLSDSVLPRPMLAAEAAPPQI
jgi:zinc D-Ala-D-Ala dipeptidase